MNILVLISQRRRAVAGCFGASRTGSVHLYTYKQLLYWIAENSWIWNTVTKMQSMYICICWSVLVSDFRLTYSIIVIVMWRWWRVLSRRFQWRRHTEEFVKIEVLHIRGHWKPGQYSTVQVYRTGSQHSGRQIEGGVRTLQEASNQRPVSSSRDHS